MPGIAGQNNYQVSVGGRDMRGWHDEPGREQNWLICPYPNPFDENASKLSWQAVLNWGKFTHQCRSANH